MPVAVGGSPNRRGVITTCTYEARRYGVRSAMSSARARCLCSDLIILPVNMQRYREVSREIHGLFRHLTQRVEPVSLDEAYLDVSDCGLFGGSATLMARELRRRIRETQGLTASTGVAPNKFLAKVASDWNKPDGELVVRPDEVESFVRELPIARIPGVGPVTAGKIRRLGIETCGELQSMDVVWLVKEFGRFGQRLHEFARGIDPRPVRSHHERKSISVERTFAEDLPDPSAFDAILPGLFAELEDRLAAAPDTRDHRIKALVLKMKFCDFSITTAQRPAREAELALYRLLCREAWMRRTLPVRLLGLGVQLRKRGGERQVSQLELWSPEQG